LWRGAVLGAEPLLSPGRWAASGTAVRTMVPPALERPNSRALSKPWRFRRRKRRMRLRLPGWGQACHLLASGP